MCFQVQWDLFMNTKMIVRPSLDHWSTFLNIDQINMMWRTDPIECELLEDDNQIHFEGPPQSFVIFDKIPSRCTETHIHFIKKYLRKV
jgi:hypothetical protein